MKLINAGVIITGASRGLGEALAQELGRRGSRLLLVARDQVAIERVVAKVVSLGGQAQALAADIAQPEAALAIAATAHAVLGDVDLVIHNASALGEVPLRPLLETGDDAFEAVLAANLLGPFRLSRALLGPMALRGRGLVVHVSSDAATSAYPTWGAYGVSKAALDHLNRIWAAELGARGVRFLSVDPGEMDTQMHADAMPEADRAALAKPSTVAHRLAQLIERAEEHLNGARVEVMR